jgi:hypothetical protein
LADAEIDIVLPFKEGETDKREKFTALMTLSRSRPNHFIYQSRMRITYCGENARLRALSNLIVAMTVVMRLFQFIFGRKIKLEEVISNGKITLWFQTIIIKPVDLDPKELNRVVFTTELISIPITKEDDLPYVITVASLYLASYILWRIDITTEDSSYYDLISEEVDIGHLSEVNLFILRFPEESAGCRGYFGNRYLHQKLMRYAYDPETRYNNCFFLCVYKALKFPLSEDEIKEDRLVLGMEPAEKIKLKSLPAVAKYYSAYIKIYRVETLPNGQKKISYWQHFGDRENGRRVRLLMKCSHFCLITDSIKIKQFRSCPVCFGWLNIKTERGKNHLQNCRKCPTCNRRYSETHTCRVKETHIVRKGVEPMKNSQWNNFTGIKNVYAADFETFQPVELGEQIVYAAGLMQVSEVEELAAKAEMRLFYGEDALNNFCNQLLNLPGKATVVFYNGSRFDFWFILRWLLKNNIKVEEILREKKSNKIMKLQFGKVKLWDLCLFTMSSLAQLGEDYGIPRNYRKQEFNHKLIKTWTDVATHKRKVSKYLYYDVLCLGLCYIKFVRKTWDLYNWSAVKCITLSHLAYDVWRNNYIEPENVQKIKLPTQEEHEYLRRALFGGRCMAYRKAFKSRHYFSYTDLQTFDAENQTAIFNNVTDYLIYLDVVSLYPFVSKQKFPVGKPKWRTGEEWIIEKILQRKDLQWSDEEVSLIRRSFVEVDVTCPRWISIPFLFARDEEGQLVQDLRDKIKQVYDGETLIEALILGYRVRKVHAWLLYPEWEVILDRYMTHSFENKAKHKKSEAEYYIYKGMMNNCTGKFSQQVIDSEQYLFHDDTFLQQFTDCDKVEKVKKIEWMKDDKDDHLGFYVEVEKEGDYSKPIHIGVCILSKSRILMSEYTRKMQGYGSAQDARMVDCPYYGDTDSLIIHVDTYNDYKLNGTFGNEWGQLKDELGSHCKIVALYCPSPKTYAMEYWSLRPDGTIKVSWYIRAKGIPKGRDGCTETLCPGAEEYFKLQALIDSTPLKPRDLKEILFSLYSRDNERLFTTTTLPFYFFEEMMCNDCYVVVHFGKLKRYLIDEHGRGSSVKLNLDLHRTINKERWWKDDGTGKRTVLTDHIWGPSVPRGHVALT